LWKKKTLELAIPMTEGVGVDVVEIPRMQRVIEKWGNNFLQRIFTDQEISYAYSKRNPAHHLAARFAVKEAVVKASAIESGGGFKWKDVEVKNDPAGKPSVVLHGYVEQSLRGKKVHVSISHSDSVVVAFVIIEKKESQNS
jgi:holo-[acyl-carrier protein] synthase